MKRVVVGISGGVDSSVAALLLQNAGYEVIGVTFRFTEEFDCSNAVKVCEKLGIEHHILDYRKIFKEKVIDKLNTMDLAGAEILSTLYAVWNNRIIKKEQVTDNLLIADFYAWSEHKADFEEARVRKALNYMRKENIVPTGWGKYIDKR